jgi:glutamine cyclotransferase
LLIILIGAIALYATNNMQTASNTTNNTTITPVIAENHFDNGLISFDYPKGWKVTNGTKAPVIVTVSKDENNSFVVMNEYLNKTSFTQRVLLWRQNIMQTGSITYESNITIDNSTGYNIEASYKVNNTTFNARGIAVEKNNTIYFIMFIFNDSLLDYKDDMNQVINSFHIIH